MRNSQVGKKILIENCTLGNFQNARKRVIVFGNSFSAAFTHAFDDLVLLDGYSVTITSSWGASPVKEIPNKGSWDKANNYYWDNIIPSLIKQLQPSDWVFLVNDMSEFSPKDRTPDTNKKFKQLENGLRTLSAQLQGIRLAILHGNPFAREAKCNPVMAIKQWFSLFSQRCKFPNRSKSLLRRTNLNKVLL